MRIFVLLITVLLLTNLCFSQPLMDGVECASYDVDNKTYVLSCWGNGKIIKIEENSLPYEFLDIGAHALGNTVYQNTIYVSTGTTIKGYDFNSGAQVMSLNVSGSHQLDGMCTDNNGFLYVADFHYQGSDDRIYKINLSTEEYEIFAEDGLEDCPQDVVFDSLNSRLIVVSCYDESAIQAIDITTGEVTDLVQNSVGNFDGAAMDSEGNFYFSSWGTGAVHKYDNNFTTSPVSITEGFDGPANLCYNPDKNELCIPEFNKDRPVFVQLIDFDEFTIDASFSGPAGIFIKDVNSDGNQDILCAGEGGVVLYYNDGNKPVNWSKEIIDDTFDLPLSVYAEDINGDNYIDIISGSWNNKGIVWWENDGNQNWTKRDIDLTTKNIHEVKTADLNDDNNMDIIAADALTNEISWWENDGNENWTKHIITNTFGGARSVFASDFDNDGDLDLAGASLTDDEITWWRNDGGSPISWMEYVINDELTYAHRVDVSDYDFDGDFDILATGYGGEILWFRNNGGDPIIWSKHYADNNFPGAVIASGADFDCDGDFDVAASSQGQNDISWWRNNGYKIPVYSEQPINNNFGEVWPLFVNDLDSDDDMDIVAGGYSVNSIKWWENNFFSGNQDPPVANFSYNFNNVCLASSVTFSDHSYGSVDTYFWDFGENASPASASTIGPHEVTYSSYGEKTVSLTVTNIYGTHTKYVTINVVDELVIETEPDEGIICNEGNVVICAYGADEFNWSPPDGLSSVTGNAVIASPDVTTTYTVTGIQGSCTGAEEITVWVADNSNNNASGAILLNYGMNGPFSNKCASPENNEPVPPAGSSGNGCNTQDGWCAGSVIENSMWFKIEAPESGRIYIAAPGFDNQIALYDADSWFSLFTGNYEILAANDDYNSSDNSAVLLDVNGLIPGDFYYLQVDGSKGGKSGEFNIELSGLPPINIEIIDNEQIEIIPNPTNGYFKIKTNIDIEGYLKIYSIDGQKVYEEKIVIASKNIEVNISNYKYGVYMLSLVCDDKIISTSFIKY